MCGAGIVELGNVLMGEDSVVMITTSWSVVYDERKMVVLKLVTFTGLGPVGDGWFNNRELFISVMVVYTYAQ